MFLTLMYLLYFPFCGGMIVMTEVLENHIGLNFQESLMASLSECVQPSTVFRVAGYCSIHRLNTDIYGSFSSVVWWRGSVWGVHLIECSNSTDAMTRSCDVGFICELRPTTVSITFISSFFPLVFYSTFSNIRSRWHNVLSLRIVTISDILIHGLIYTL